MTFTSKELEHMQNAMKMYVEMRQKELANQTTTPDYNQTRALKELEETAEHVHNALICALWDDLGALRR